MDILETIRTVYKDTDEIAGWCDLNTYKGSETNIHLRGMYKTLLKSADEIERLREALRLIRDELGDTPMDSMKAYEISDAVLKDGE